MINDKVVAGFGRHEAPVLSLQGALGKEETIFIISGLIPNLKGHPLVHSWYGVTFQGKEFDKTQPFDKILAETGLDNSFFANPEVSVDIPSIRTLLPQAIKQARLHISKERKVFEDNINEKLNKHLTALDRLKGKHYRQLDLFYASKKQHSHHKNRKEQQKREIDRTFDDFIKWVEETMTTEDNPFIQVIAVLQGVA